MFLSVCLASSLCYWEGGLLRNSATTRVVGFRLGAKAKMEGQKEKLERDGAVFALYTDLGEKVCWLMLAYSKGTHWGGEEGKAGLGGAGWSWVEQGWSVAENFPYSMSLLTGELEFLLSGCVSVNGCPLCVSPFFAQITV